MPRFEWLALANRGSPASDRAWVRVLLAVALGFALAVLVVLSID
jgi:hypothetical protein